MRKSLSLILAMLLALSTLVSCTGTTTEEETTTPETETVTTVEETTEEVTTEEATTEAPVDYSLKALTFAEIKDKLVIDGRSQFASDGSMSLDWTGAAFEFTAKCKGNISVCYMVSSDAGSGNPVYVTVSIDGGRAYERTLTQSTTLQTLALGVKLEEGTHTFRVERQTMVETGTDALRLDINYLKIYGEVVETAQKDKYIEFIGDSITCGVGIVAGDNANHGGETYAVKTAKLLNANYSVVSISGIGMKTSTSRFQGKNILDFYPYYNGFRSTAVADEYVPERQADLIVINLGTNDFGNGASEQDFKENARTLINMARTMNGSDTPIVFIVGMMVNPSNAKTQWVRDVAGEYTNTYILTANTDTSGGDNHPAASSHTAVATKLVNLIETQIWGE